MKIFPFTQRCAIHPVAKRSVILIYSLLLAAGFVISSHAADDDSRIAIFTSPPTGTPTDKMPDGPLLGNGDVGVVMGGPPEAQTFYIGKNDLWAGDHVIPVGRVLLSIPALKGGTYHQEQDIAIAEVRGTFTKDAVTIHMRSRVDANKNLVVTELQCDGSEPVSVSVRVFSGEQVEMPVKVVDNGQPANIGREMHGGGRWFFKGRIGGVVVTDKVLTGAVPGLPEHPEQFNENTQLRRMDVPKMDKSVSVAAWIKIDGEDGEANYIVSKGDWEEAYSLGLSGGRLRWAVGKTYVQTEQPLETGKWLYVVGTFDGQRLCAYVDGVLKASYGNGSFVRKVGIPPLGERKVAVDTRVVGASGLDFTLKPGTPVSIATSVLSNLNAADPQSSATQLVGDLTASTVMNLDGAHRAWWSDFWSRSFIEIPDKVIEKHWYAALYAMASCSRPGKTAPGLWGNWATVPSPAWNGDFHLNYDFEAPFYIVYSSNHADLSLPFYQALMDWLPKAEGIAKARGWKGAYYPVAIGPWGINSPDSGNDFGQRSNGALAAMPFIWYWQYTQDAAFLHDTAYPFLSEIAAFWEDYLKLENGRYVIHSDSIHEGSGPDVNPLISLGLVRTLFKNMIEMSQKLNVDADKRAKWQDILDRLSAFPLHQMNGRTVFRYTETGMGWNGTNTLGIYHIFPAGAIGLDSDPKLLEISRNMIDEMHRWHDQNGFSSFYTACARVGYDPKTILAKLHKECEEASMPNLVLQFGGGGVENLSGFLAVNEMLLQSHEGVLRLFPDWPKDEDARFGSLRAVGAFLVSAGLKGGVVGDVKIVSEKGSDCTVVNPWPARRVEITSDGRRVGVMEGERFTFKTGAGETLQLDPL